MLDRCRDEECDGCQCPESSTLAIFTTWLPVGNWAGRRSLDTGAPLPQHPPVPELVLVIITIPGDITHMLTPGRAPSALTKIRVAKQGNKSLCQLKLMGYVIPVTTPLSFYIVHSYHWMQKYAKRVTSVLCQREVAFHRVANSTSSTSQIHTYLAWGWKTSFSPCICICPASA